MQWFAYPPLDTSTAITFPTCPASVLRGSSQDGNRPGGGAEAEKADTITHMHRHIYTYIHACVLMYRHAHIQIYIHMHTDTLMERVLAITNQEVHSYVHLGCVVIHDDVVQVWPTPSYNK